MEASDNRDFSGFVFDLIKKKKKSQKKDLGQAARFMTPLQSSLPQDQDFGLMVSSEGKHTHTQTDVVPLSQPCHVSVYQNPSKYVAGTSLNVWRHNRCKMSGEMASGRDAIFINV